MRRPSRQTVLRLIAGISACVLLPYAAQAQETDLAAAVKATYLYKFAAFIRWPSPATEFPGDVFPLCIVGSDGQFSRILDRAVRGQAVEGHRVAARSLSTPTDGTTCAVVFIQGANAQPIVQALHGKPVLTVTDEAVDPSARGIINFVIRDNRVRFEIDAAAANAAGLAISSKLLALAVSPNPDSH